MMKAYRRYVLIYLVAVAVYVPMSTVLWARFQRELFPFAPWELFSHVPNAHHDFGVRVISVDGQAVDGAPYLETLPGIPAEGYSINAHITIQTLGQQLESGDEAGAAATRAFFEERYLAGVGTMVYSVYARDSVPLARWNEAGFLREVEVAQFEMGAR